ncbi:hypothetical protein A2335_03705 [Candidatus Peregrinibacteria bacterium RIFOXYB2_FULL_32_7]|nr:MAG: hypothetical protein A2335_03705 [Candidatus Peregrinibacteria bacterium RIFOXYB2_FULL_32_7]
METQQVCIPILKQFAVLGRCLDVQMFFVLLVVHFEIVLIPIFQILDLIVILSLVPVFEDLQLTNLKLLLTQMVQFL